ncbi:MAG: iron permease, partial [Planctomycetales bacterium]|nr:iron permease [Planctomycetales bacterium]
MTPLVLLTYYCSLILASSILGGMIPVWFKLTHRGMQFASSFVAGVMLGVALFDMLPHAFVAGAAGDPAAASRTCLFVLLGLLAMFFTERFFCFHHHDVDASGNLAAHDHEHEHHDCGAQLEDGAHDHQHHDVTGIGAALGLTLHSVIGGVALAASVAHRHDNLSLAGLGTFLVILLHKPFD